MSSQKKQLNLTIVLALMVLFLGLLYVLEVNVIIHDSFRREVIKKQIRELALRNQSLAVRSAIRLNTQSMEEVKGRFSLIEVKALTSIEPKTGQFSLKGYHYSQRSGQQGAFHPYE